MARIKKRNSESRFIFDSRIRNQSFTRSCGYEMEKDEQGRYQLPYLMESDISGNPVTIKVVHDKWTNSEGEERVTPLAVNVFKSKDRVAPLKDEELPF